ncbi:hypothetical protein B7463_g8459, partial [Scytalidium lignicola]
MATRGKENGEPNSFAPTIGPSQEGPRHQVLDNGSKVIRERFQRVVKNISTTRGNYRHEEIDYNNDIRILKIHHGGPNTELKCMLFPSALTTNSRHPKHSYWALSYWWGETNEQPRNKIRIYYNSSVKDGKEILMPFHDSDTFYIRNNLKSALERLRHPTKDVNVWVDAICINQDDKTEKNAQVSKMHEVYMRADNVCIWLGEGRDQTKETFEFLREILDLRNLDKLIQLPIPNSRKWALVIDLMTNRWFSRRWVIQELALSKKATVRWGEMELAWTDFADAIALFMTKYEEIKRTSLDPAGHHPALDARALGANTIIHATINLFRKASDGGIEQRLLPLEILVSSLLLAFEAGEPRDTIFAVLTLAKDSQHGTARVTEDPRIAPNYDKDLLDVYTDFMDYCMEQSRSLDIICRYWAPLPKQADFNGITPSPPKEESMPSWVPFITKSAFGEPHGVRGGRVNGDSLVGGPERKGQQTYNASGGIRSWHKFGTNNEPSPISTPNALRRATFQVMPNTDGPPKFQKKGKQSHQKFQRAFTGFKGGKGRGMNTLSAPFRPKYNGKYSGILSVRGFSIAEIDVVSDRVSGNGVISSEALELAGWKHNGPKNQDVPDQLWRTLVADRGPNGTSTPSWYRRTCLECLQHTDRAGDLDIDNLKRTLTTPSTMITYLERVQQIVWKRRFFTAKPADLRKSDSHFGLGSSDIKNGDLVCIFFGCSVPVVVRRIIEDGKDTPFYQFIGECYVHGMMDGEAITDKKPNRPYKDRRFDLR